MRMEKGILVVTFLVVILLSAKLNAMYFKSRSHIAML